MSYLKLYKLTFNQVFTNVQLKYVRPGGLPV